MVTQALMEHLCDAGVRWGGCQGEGECVQGHTGLGGGCQGAWCHLVAWTQLPWHCTRNGGTAHEAHACLGCGPGERGGEVGVRGGRGGGGGGEGGVG